MFQLACKDLGATNLDPKVDHVITGNSADAAMKKAMAQAHHAEMLKTATSPQQLAEMEKMMKRKITNKAKANNEMIWRGLHQADPYSFRPFLRHKMKSEPLVHRLPLADSFSSGELASPCIAGQLLL